MTKDEFDNVKKAIDTAFKLVARIPLEVYRDNPTLSSQEAALKAHFKITELHSEVMRTFKL